MDKAEGFADAAIGIGLTFESSGDPYGLFARQWRRSGCEAAGKTRGAQIARERKPVAISHRQWLDVDDGHGEADALEQIAHRGEVDLRMQPRDRPHPVGHHRAAEPGQASVADKGAEQQAVGREQGAQADKRAGHVVDAVEPAGPDDEVETGKGQVDGVGLDHDGAALGRKTRSCLGDSQVGAERAQMVRERAIMRTDEQGARKFARHHRQPIEQGFGDDRRQEIGGCGKARQAVALGTVAGGREKRAGGLRHAPLVPSPAMLHKSGMASATGDAGKEDAPTGRLLGGLRVAARAIVDYALPPRCPGCGIIVSEDRQFCLTCWSSLDFMGGPSCLHCSIPLPTALAGAPIACGACLATPPPFDGAPAALAYGPVARTVALRLKYGRRTGHARLMAQLMARQLATLGEADTMLLVPVPLHRWRLWSRGFNQAALVADELARLTGAPRDHHLLLRIKATASLRGKGRRERDRIVAGAFALAGDAKTRVAGRHLVLVDDVHASGATLRAAARALRRSGATRVSALTWARVVPDALMTGNIFDFASLDSDMTDQQMTG